MKITSEINDPTILKAAGLVMRHYRDAAFLEKVGRVEKFNHTADSAARVAIKIMGAENEIIIRPYTTFNPWSRVIGHARDNIIFVNTRKLDLPLLDRVENFYHEWLHTIGYSHKGNRVNSYNLGTVPYKVAKMFREHVQWCL
jgi:hypothetical protein